MIEKNVFITGGDKGIGAGITSLLATIYKNIVITFNNNRKGAEDLASKYDNVRYYQCSLENPNSIYDVADKVLSEFGHIDILINNAGYEKDVTFEKMTAKEWESVIRINLESIYYFTHIFSKQMIENKWGRIINVTSIAAYTGAFGKSNYSAAKAGIVGFTKSLSLELGKKNICVNAVAPGAINTDMLMRIPEKYRNQILENIPSKRFGEVEDVADLVSFLSSDKAAYINGQTIHVNGGSYSI